MTTSFTKGIKKNHYAPRTGHDNPSAQTRTNLRISNPHWYVVLKLTVLTLVRVLKCHLTLFSWLSTNMRRPVVTRFVLRVPLNTLNQPRLNRNTRSRRKKGGVLWRVRWYDGCPRGIPGTNAHAGKVSSCAEDLSTRKYTDKTEAAPCLHPPTKLRETSAVGAIAA